jgi:hypothetical protein
MTTQPLRSRKGSDPNGRVPEEGPGFPGPSERMGSLGGPLEAPHVHGFTGSRDLDGQSFVAWPLCRGGQGQSRHGSPPYPAREFVLRRAGTAETRPDAGNLDGVRIGGLPLPWRRLPHAQQDGGGRRKSRGRGRHRRGAGKGAPCAPPRARCAGAIPGAARPPHSSAHPGDRQAWSALQPQPLPLRPPPSDTRRGARRAVDRRSA